MRKIVKIFASLVVALIVSMSPLVAFASTTIPIPTIDFNYKLDHSPYDGAFDCRDYPMAYSTVRFYPNVNNTLVVRIDAEGAGGRYKYNNKLYVTCIDSRTNKEVGFVTLDATKYQYATFTGLDSSDSYYLKFQGNCAGTLYVSKDGLYAF